MSECSCSGCWHLLCCSDPCTQAPATVGCLSGTAVAAGGCALGHVPVAVLGGIAATTNCVALVRMACLGDNVHLNHGINGLNHAIDDLGRASAAQALEIQSLQAAALRIHSDLESMKQERDAMRQQQEGHLKQIAELTQSLDALQKRYATVCESCATIQRTLSSSATEQAGAAVALHDDADQFADTIPLLTRSISDLKAAATQAHLENERMKQSLADLKQEESVLQSQIIQYQQEKEALERLIKAQQSETELQQRIDEGTKQLASIEARIAELLPQLQQMQALMTAAPAQSSPS